MARSYLTRRPRAHALALTVALAVSVLVAGPSEGVNRDLGNRLVSDVPSGFTPHVVDGAVLSFVQVGSKMYAAGNFTRVRQTPEGPDIRRNGIFAFDAATGQIDTAFDPDLGGAANSLDTDGSFVYVGGSFGSVGGDTTLRRLVKLTPAGAVVRGLAEPSAGVNDVVVRGNRLFIGGQFTSVGGVSRRGLAVLDSGTGAVSAVDVPFTGTFNGGSTSITRMDVDPAGTTVVAVGNFTSVGGQPREQVALVSTPAGATATVSGWATERFSKARNATCSESFQTWVRDVDISPDGRYFVVTTSGSFGGGAATGALCDTTTRWELGRTGGGQEPSWVTYAGGDTSYGVAVAGGVVYTGGHFRWQNSPFEGDQVGPGAVPREGVAALDPVNGLPLSWNPGRTRGVGAQALYVTSAGLWVGSDTERFANRLRMRIAFLPVTGGKDLPVVRDATLPGTVYLVPRAPSSRARVLHRVNAGGAPVQSGDVAAHWTTDSGRATGGVAAGSTAIPVPDSTVGSAVPWQLFSTQRAGAHRYAFPVSAGTKVIVRLYFANTAASTAAPGQQLFDVSVDNRPWLDDFDVVAAAGGHLRGTARQTTVVSDGSVDIALSAVLGNPIVSAVEIIDATKVRQPLPRGLQRLTLDGSGTVTSPPVTVATDMDYSRVRGATLVGRTMYYGLPDGALHARDLDPATGALGPDRLVELYDDPEDSRRIPFPVANITGMAYDADSRRLFYTLFADPKLYYRYFSPESEVVGAETLVANGGSVNWSTTAGLTVVDDRLLYGSTADGVLRSVSLVAGGVASTPSVVSGGGSWRHRDLFVAPSS